jgi:hypothetical protein
MTTNTNVPEVADLEGTLMWLAGRLVQLIGDPRTFLDPEAMQEEAARVRGVAEGGSETDKRAVLAELDFLLPKVDGPLEPLYGMEKGEGKNVWILTLTINEQTVPAGAITRPA